MRNRECMNDEQTGIDKGVDEREGLFARKLDAYLHGTCSE